MQIIVGCRRSAHWLDYHAYVAARVHVHRKYTYTCIRLLACWHHDTWVHVSSHIQRNFHNLFWWEVCQAKHLLLHWCQHDFRVKRNTNAPFSGGDEAILSSSWWLLVWAQLQKWGYRQKAQLRLIGRIKSQTTKRKCVFRLHVFDSGRRYLNKIYFHLRNMLPFCRLPTSTEIGANSRVSVAERLQPKQQQRSGNDKLFSSWTVIRPLLWLLMITTHEERGWRSWVIHSISPAGPWCEKCRCFLFLWSIYVLTVPKILSRPQFSFHFSSVSVNPAPVRWGGRRWVVPVYYGAQRVVPQVPVQRSRLYL